MTSHSGKLLASLNAAPNAHAGAERSIIHFVRFLAAGGFAAFVNLASRYLLTPIVGFEVSIVVAYLVGVAVAIILFR